MQITIQTILSSIVHIFIKLNKKRRMQAKKNSFFREKNNKKENVFKIRF